MTIGKDGPERSLGWYDKKMRLSRALLACGATLPLLTPLAAHAVGIPFFGPIVPPGASTCAAGWMAALDLVNRAIAFALTIGIVFIAPMSIAYAGFLFVVNPVNPSGVSKARSVLLNTIVGIVIALAAWLIVDTVLTVLTAPDKGVSYWTAQLFRGGDTCLPVNTTSLNQSAGQTGDVIGSGPGITIGPGGTGDVEVSCPPDAERAGVAGCARDGQFVIPNGESCPNGTEFSGDYGGCRDASGNISVPIGAPIANGQQNIRCPDGAVPAGNGCANTTTNQFVLPQGQSCPNSAPFNGDYGGCLAGDNTVTAPNGSPALNPTVPQSLAGASQAQQAAAALDSIAHGQNNYGGECWSYVRRALNEAGYNVSSGQNSVGGLTSAGFQVVTQNTMSGYAPQAGDVVHIDPVGNHVWGHVAMFNGSNWVSDTVQTNGFNPYRDQRDNPNLRFQVFRHP